MNQVTKMFENQNLTIVTNGDKYEFLLRDLCNILDLGQTSAVKRRLDDDVISNHPIQDSLGRTQQATFVNEDGLYDVILDSRKPEAKRFRKWITSEVLPSIRKTGSYSTNKIVPLNDKQSLIAAMKLSVENSEDIDQVKGEVKELRYMVEEQITLTSGEQRRLQKGIAQKVYKIESDQKARSSLFRELHREIKDRFGVASYKDIKRKELQSALSYIEHWIPRKVS